MKYKVVLNLEEDYRLEVYDNKGFKDKVIDLKLDDMKEVVKDMCGYMDNEDIAYKLIGNAYQVFNLKTITMIKD